MLLRKESCSPPGLDMQAWERMLSSFKGASSKLAAAMAAAARKLCTDQVRRAGVDAFFSSAFGGFQQKNPGVRPRAVGEVYRRIIAQAILTLLLLLCSISYVLTFPRLVNLPLQRVCIMICGIIFRNVAGVEKVVELSEVWRRKCMVFRKWIFGSLLFGSA